MGQLLLVRHGQASWGSEDYDVLSPLGWEQSRMLGETLAARDLAPDLLVQGGMRRHRETLTGMREAAGWVAQEPVNDRGWNEFDHLGMLAAAPAPAFGAADPTPAEFQHWFEEATGRWIAGEGDYTESFAGFGGRVDEALERTCDLVGSDATALVSTSGGAIAWVAATLLAGDPAEAAAPRVAQLWAQLNKVVVNTGVTKVVLGRRGATLVSFNEHAHLEGGGLTYR